MISYNIAGLATNVNFLMDLAAHPEFATAMWTLSLSRGILIRYNIAGLATTVNFLMDLAGHPEFVAGNVDTEFILRHYDQVLYSGVGHQCQLPHGSGRASGVCGGQCGHRVHPTAL
jgi:acetyl/propionyl-CoA carboxylase alpha subunit